MKRQLLLLLAVLSVAVQSASGQSSAPIKNRAYYVSQNEFIHTDFTPGSYRIHKSAVSPGSQNGLNLGAFIPNSGFGVICSILALFNTPKQEDGIDYHGYVALGTEGVRLSSLDGPTFCTKGSFTTRSQWTTNALNNLETDGLSIIIPKYIDLNNNTWHFLGMKTGSFNDEGIPDWLVGKRLKVVGLDSYALFGATVRICLPSSVTYVGYKGLYDTGRQDLMTGKPSVALGFHPGSGTWPYYPKISSYPYYDSNQLTDDPTSADWKEWNNIESLGAEAVSHASYRHVTDVVNPNKLREWGNQCFAFSREMESVDLSVFTHSDMAQLVIPDSCFYRPEKLTTVNIGDRVTKIGNGAFSGLLEATATTYTPIKTVIFGSGLQELGERCFAAGSIDSVKVDPSCPLTSIGKEAFRANPNLSYFNFPSQVSRIEQAAFKECGFQRRFDVPVSLTYIGDEAFADNKIMQIHFSNGTTGTLTYMGDKAFQPKVTAVTGPSILNDILANEPSWHLHYLVEFEDAVPPAITSDGNPFFVPESHLYGYVRRHVIVPTGCAEDYQHSTESAVSMFNHHEYCAKFDLTKNYALPPYGQSKATPEVGDIEVNGKYYSPAPWRIASSAWKPQSRHGSHGDIYTFKPDHDGTLVRLTSTPGATNQMGEEKDVYDVEIVYGYNYPKYILSSITRTLLTSDDVNARTAHAYFKNDRADDIPKISTAKVEDGIVPPGEGILISYATPGTYLVPLYGDVSFLENVTVPVVRRSTLTLGSFPTTLSDYCEAGSGRYQRNTIESLSAEASADQLEAMKGQVWVDFNEVTAAPVRSLYVFNTSTGDYNATQTKISLDTININETVEYNGTSYPKYKVINNNNGARATYYYKTYTISSDIDWKRAAVEGYDYVKTQLMPEGEFAVTWAYNRTNYNSTFNYYEGANSDTSYWIDIFNLGTQANSGSSIFEKDFYANYEDAQNVLVPCWEPRKVWPAWQVVDEATYNTLAEDARHIEKHLYHKDDYLYYLKGMTLAELNALGSASDVDGFLSFGLSNGYFVPAKVANYTQANRSYFRIHTTHLHAKHTEVAAGGKAVIMDEGDINSETTGISDINRTPATTATDTWYTLQGTRLQAKPTQSGIYINNGKKVIIK